MKRKIQKRKAIKFSFQPFSVKQTKILTWWTESSPYKDYDGIIADGAIRSGKTLSMSLSFVTWAMVTYDGMNFAICGKTIGSLRRNVIGTLKQMLFSRKFDVEEYRSDNLLVINYRGHENYFYLFGGTDERSQDLIQGITLAGILLDEVALMPESFVNQATGRCSIAGSKMWFNCNPDSPKHFFYTEWIGKIEERKFLYLHFRMTDNLSLAPEIIERYRRQYSGVFYQRYILGLWVKAEGLVYPMFEKSRHVVHIDDYSPKLRHRYYVSIDYGTVNPFAAGLYDFDPVSKKTIMIRELYYNGKSTNRVDNEAYYRMLTDLIGDYTIEYIVIDPSASSMIETINKYGKYMCVKADNDVINGIQNVTKFLNLDLIQFADTCTSTFDEFLSYSWDEEKNEDEVIKVDDHSMDQLRYMVHTVLRNELKWVV